jgi:hypothetical protein
MTPVDTSEIKRKDIVTLNLLSTLSYEQEAMT